MPDQGGDGKVFLRRQPKADGCQGQRHGGQELARLVVECMGHPAALGLRDHGLAGTDGQPHHTQRGTLALGLAAVPSVWYFSKARREYQ